MLDAGIESGARVELAILADEFRCAGQGCRCPEACCLRYERINAVTPETLSERGQAVAVGNTHVDQAIDCRENAFRNCGEQISLLCAARYRNRGNENDIVLRCV